MKLLKVGSSPSCDIVLNSDYVSGHHADITVLDNGEVFIEDKNSKNGTYIGVAKKRITPGQEYPVQRGERVLFGNEPLRWDKVPQPTYYNKAQRVINIGSNQRNDLVIPGSAVSRYHATLVIGKDKKATIIDNKSTNGTKVNGQKLVPGRPMPVKRGDNVIVGEEDITSRIEDYLPKQSNGLKIAGIVGGIAAAIAVVACVVKFLILPLFNNIPDTAVVMVANTYHYNLELSENPYNIPLKVKVGPFTSYGTGFFIDKEGRMATNRHVACPWLEEYQKMDAYSQLKVQDLLKQGWDNVLAAIPKKINDIDDITILSNVAVDHNEVGMDIIKAWKNNTDGSLRSLNNMLERIHKTPVKITGESDNLSVAYANRHYTHSDEFSRAILVAESGTPTQDVAILQLNTQETPKKFVEAGILDIEKVNLHKPVVQKEELIFKGYPDGLARTWDDHYKSSTNIPTTYKGRVSRVSNPNQFEIQAKTTHGASGSPVYYKGVLYGIVSGGHTSGDDVIVESARHLKSLYDKEVAPYRE